MSELAGGLRHALDPVGWAAAVLGFEPDAVQAEVIGSRKKRILLNCCRQWGKSTTAAARAVHQALFVPESLIMAVSPTLRQTAELLRKMKDILERVGVRPRPDGFNPVSLRLENGSRMVGVPAVESSVRGFSSVDLLIVDEAARVKDDLYLALRPTMAVPRRGRPGTLILMSTPFGQRGFFWDIWSNKDKEIAEKWLRVQVRATECPRISEEFLREELRSLGEHWFKQEYHCVFQEPKWRIFTDDLIQRALTPNLEPLFWQDGEVEPKADANDWLWKGTIEVNKQFSPGGPVIPSRVK
ncbi:MAG: terminase family protein [Bryobacteraceae bacterium]